MVEIRQNWSSRPYRMWRHVVWQIDANNSKEPSASIFMAEEQWNCRNRGTVLWSLCLRRAGNLAARLSSFERNRICPEDRGSWLPPTRLNGIRFQKIVIRIFTTRKQTFPICYLMSFMSNHLIGPTNHGNLRFHLNQRHSIQYRSITFMWRIKRLAYRPMYKIHGGKYIYNTDQLLFNYILYMSVRVRERTLYTSPIFMIFNDGPSKCTVYGLSIRLTQSYLT
jgi:hypothetical protein